MLSIYKFSAALVITSVILYTSCVSTTGSNAARDSVITASPTLYADTIDNVITGGDTSDYVILYLAIADTGKDYNSLRTEMFAINKALAIPIDTMGRYYNTKKKEIVLPDDDNDEMYRGQYFPRRFPSVSLSLEYYKTYDDISTSKNIALVAGMYEHKASADSALAAISSLGRHAFVLKAPVYAGCMH